MPIPFLSPFPHANGSTDPSSPDYNSTLHALRSAALLASAQRHQTHLEANAIRSLLSQNPFDSLLATCTNPILDRLDAIQSGVEDAAHLVACFAFGEQMDPATLTRVLSRVEQRGDALVNLGGDMVGGSPHPAMELAPDSPLLTDIKQETPEPVLYDRDYTPPPAPSSPSSFPDDSTYYSSLSNTITSVSDAEARDISSSATDDFIYSALQIPSHQIRLYSPSDDSRVPSEYDDNYHWSPIPYSFDNIIFSPTPTPLPLPSPSSSPSPSPSFYASMPTPPHFSSPSDDSESEFGMMDYGRELSDSEDWELRMEVEEGLETPSDSSSEEEEGSMSDESGSDWVKSPSTYF
ncbi:hypothetical protein P7C70_g7205, partial [Phenoliferia sp. Uapishka_3]